MKKIKQIIELFLLILFIAIILFFFINIENLMPNFEGEVLSKPNKYFENQKEINPLDYIEKATVVRKVTKEEEKLFDTDLVKSLYKKNIQAERDTTNKNKNDDLFKYSDQYVVPETKYGDIFYQVEEYYNQNRTYHVTYILFFTKDQKSIYYYTKTDGSTQEFVEKQSTYLDKVTLLNKIQAFLSDLRLIVPENEPTITITEEGNYLLNYEKQNLEILYDSVKEEITTFILNF